MSDLRTGPENEIGGDGEKETEASYSTRKWDCAHNRAKSSLPQFRKHVQKTPEPTERVPKAKAEVVQAMKDDVVETQPNI